MISDETDVTFQTSADADVGVSTSADADADADVYYRSQEKKKTPFKNCFPMII